MKEYAKELTWKADDLECDFDPEYLETQIAIADNQKELEWLAQVVVRQLKRETDFCDACRVECERYRKNLRKIYDQVEEFQFG